MPSPGSYPCGLTFDGTYLWNADNDTDKIYKLDTSGNIVDSFDSPARYSGDLAFDGTYLFVVGNWDHKIHKLDTSGNIITSFDTPSAIYGLTFDGTYFWYSDGVEDKIYKIIILPVYVGSSKSQTFTVTNSGTADLVIGTLLITGTDASEFRIENDNCSGQTIAPLGICTCDGVFAPTSEGKKSANLGIPSNDPATPTLNVPLSGTGIREEAPQPDIKANGSDGPVTISQSDTLSVTIALNAAGNTDNADWWVLTDTPVGWYRYNVWGVTWVPGLTVTYQGPLADLGSYEVLNMSGLPLGDYTFYFGVDTVMNSSIDLGQLYYDSVGVTIE
jgi:hypothetical protein